MVCSTRRKVICIITTCWLCCCCRCRCCEVVARSQHNGMLQGRACATDLPGTCRQGVVVVGWCGKVRGGGEWENMGAGLHNLPCGVCHALHATAGTLLANARFGSC